MADVRDLIERTEDELGTITQRLFVLEAFAAELERVSRGKPFRIWGSAVWMMILDSRDAHVTHLASWLKSLYGRGGFFGQLAAHHAKDFPRKWRPQRKTKPSPDFARILEKQHAEAFSRTFPDIQRSRPSQQDFQALRQRFVARVEHVVADRDVNRAHPYERSGAAAGTIKQLDFKELRAITTFIESLLNDLRLLTTSSSFIHGDMNFQSADTLAEELGDSVLIGSRSRAEFVMAGADRECFYGRIHDRHVALGNPEEPLFNDPDEEDDAQDAVAPADH